MQLMRIYILSTHSVRLDGMAEVHHKDRVADKPERAFDPTNLAVIRKDEHSEYHNSDYPQNEKGYEQFEKKYKK